MSSLTILTLVTVALTPAIEWDASTLTLIEKDAIYGRMIRLDTGDRDLLCVYDLGGKIWTRRSRDEGKSWKDRMAVATYGSGVATNPEILLLKNGALLCSYNERPNDGKHPFRIMTTRSSDGGAIWSEPTAVYTADTRFENGCWEPAAIRLPSGEIHLFFANESPYRRSSEQEITLVRSRDDGTSWSEPRRVSFRAGSRDGMPVPLVLERGRGIVLAIEDNGLNGNFKPAIVFTSLRDGWRKTRRWRALAEPLQPDVYAGAPYIRQLPGGPTVLSVQSDEGGRKEPQMVVYVGDALARNFTGKSVPFKVSSETKCLWNSLFVKDRQTVTAISGTTMRGVRGLWSIDGRLVRRGRK